MPKMIAAGTLVRKYPEEVKEEVLAHVRANYNIEDVLRACPDSVTMAFLEDYYLEKNGGMTLVEGEVS